MERTEYFTKTAPYFDLVFDPRLIIKNIQIVNENLVAVTYEQEEDFIDVLPNTNPVIAAYTTAQARLKLYSYIEKLQDRTIYMDTDSLVYLEKPGDVYKPLIGNFLGEMTDELEKEGPGSYITTFVSTGPKNYGYKMLCGASRKIKTVIKVKGFNIDHETSALINFENLVNMVKLYVRDGCRLETHVLIPLIEWTKDQTVISVYRKKVYRLTYDKRKILPDFSTNSVRV